MERLKKRSDFVLLSKAGARWVTPAFTLLILKRVEGGPFRYGITASKKIGGAVERNRAKRRLRAIIREVLPTLGQPGIDYVLIARTEVLKRDFALMINEFKDSLEKIHSKL